MENPMENHDPLPNQNFLARFRRLRSALVPGYLQGTALPRPLQRRSACLRFEALAMEREKGHGYQ